MSKDFYFRPDNVRIGTDFRDPKDNWFIQFNYDNMGVSFKISKKLKKQIIDSIKNNMIDTICMDKTWVNYFE
jgi:hypothetical protein